MPSLPIDLAHGLANGLPAPSSGRLAADPHLEASAAKAMDILDANRVVGVLHADDPILFASGAGALQETVKLLAT